MNVPLLIDSLLLGMQHSFEPDHVAAVSVLAGEKANRKIAFFELVWRSTQWALGHSFTLILFSLLTLVLKLSFSIILSSFAEKVIIGPLMILLGASAIFRIKKFTKQEKIEKAKKEKENFIPWPTVSPVTYTVRLKLNRSFGVGMLHGLAGTGAAVSIALTLAAENSWTAMILILIQCLGILLTMTFYSSMMIFSVSIVNLKNRRMLQALNLITGIVSIMIGIMYLYNSIFV